MCETSIYCFIYMVSNNKHYNPLFNQEKSKLGSTVLCNDDVMENEIARVGATGKRCLEFLQSIAPGKPFRLIEKKRVSGGRVLPFIRRMVIGPNLDECSYKSILTMAHKYAHMCQSEQHWTLFSLLTLLSTGYFLVSAGLVIFDPGGTLILVLIIITLVSYLIGHTTKEIDAISRSVSFVRLYLRHEGFNEDELHRLMWYLEHQSRAELVWYLITDIGDTPLPYLMLFTIVAFVRWIIPHIL